MSIGIAISRLRLGENLSQEKFAQKLNVTRQAVQKWESGSTQPDLDNIIKISKLFNVSVDSLVLSDNKRLSEILYEKKLQPAYNNIHEWELYSTNLLTEYQQSVDEGKDMAQYEDLFKAVSKMHKGEEKEKIADILFNIVQSTPLLPEYKYNEPSDLFSIRELRPEFTYNKTEKLDKDKLKDKILGAWLGRVCGCLLGKPVEGIKTNELHPILKESNNFPMHRYINSTDITEKMYETFSYRLKGRCYADTISCAPVDDDTNYTVLSNVLVDKYGRDFTPCDVSQIWSDYQPRNAYCTAERVAFCNFTNGFLPPDSAVYKNPYREWIGAQIRGDYFGYINPGNPELAAEMAWRDASISHIKNGIYGEMFISAMIAHAAVNSDIEEIILGGLAQIPETSRLFEVISKTVNDFKNGVSEKDCFSEIHKLYNEHNGHDWCHTISNAIIVVAALLYGGGNYGKSICMAVQAGFDTDCNGATVGSILGMRDGVSTISDEWTKPLNDTLDTSIFGVGKVKITDIVEATMKHLPEDMQ